MNIARWRKNDHQFLPLSLDPDFEETCRKEVKDLTRASMQTPTERLREAMENIIIVLSDEAKADKEAGDNLFRQAQEKHQASCDKLAEIEKIKQSCRALSEPARGIAPSPKTTRKKAREVAAA